MKKLMTLFLILLAPAALAETRAPADAETVASAGRFIAAHCTWEHADFSLVVVSSVDEARRVDQNMFDHRYTLDYGSRSAHSGSIYAEALRLTGQRDYDESDIRWTVAMDAFGLCD